MSDFDSNERDALRRALREGPTHGIECIRGERPAMLDGEGVRALTTPFLAAFMIAAAIFRQQVATTRFDLWALLLRTAALAFVVRAILVLVRVFARVWRQREATAHTLVWSRHGLLWSAKGAEVFVARNDVVHAFIVETRSRFADARPLLLVLSPRTGRTHLEIPPYFSAGSEVLLARIERAWSLSEPREKRDVPPPPSNASAAKRYEDAARGTHGERDIVIPEGRGYLWRGPYASLLGIPFSLDALRVSGDARPTLLPAVLVACVLALFVPAVYLALAKKRGQARLGIGMLLAREELIVRGARGALSLSWSQLESAEVLAKQVWSPFVGGYISKQLVLRGRDGSTIAFDAGFLGTPPEVVAALCHAYASGAFEALDQSC